MAVRKTGTVKALKEGYGFIQDQSGGPDHFFHGSDLGNIDFDMLKLNQIVTFDSALAPKGKRATNVRIALWDHEDKPVKAPPVLPGPVSIFRGKVRKPVTLTLTPEHHVRLESARMRMKCSRADAIALLIDQFADVVKKY